MFGLAAIIFSILAAIFHYVHVHGEFFQAEGFFLIAFACLCIHLVWGWVGPVIRNRNTNV